METIDFHYRFKLRDGTEKEFDLHLDKKSLRLVPLEKESPPQWTELTHCQCPNCPLDPAKEKYCPVAFNLADLIGFFKNFISYEEVDLTIETGERGYFKHVPLQKGISSLLGVYMTTSGCPVLDKLKPMARFHLPFANLEETQYRVLSMYLLAQYFLKKKGKKPDWDLKELPKIYDGIRIVNKAFCERLKTLKGEDAVPNAVVILDTFAQGISFMINKDALHKMENIFSAYLEGGGS